MRDQTTTRERRGGSSQVRGSGGKTGDGTSARAVGNLLSDKGKKASVRRTEDGLLPRGNNRSENNGFILGCERRKQSKLLEDPLIPLLLHLVYFVHLLPTEARPSLLCICLIESLLPQQPVATDER